MTRLPNLLIAGIPKAATTSLFSYLSQHPQVCPSGVKEVNYFTTLRRADAELEPLSEYTAHFAACDDQPYLMEASPGYAVGGAPVIAGIRRVLDHPRILITLRDPVQRLWSAYTFQVARGQMKGVSSFEHFVALCEQSRRDGVDGVPGNLFAALSIGFYIEYVPDWVTAFGDDLKVVFAEQLLEAPQAVVADVSKWLGIDVEPVRTFDYRPRNRTITTQSALLDRAGYLIKRATRPARRVRAVRTVLAKAHEKMGADAPREEMHPAIRRYLDDTYRQSNRELARLLVQRGYGPLPAWLQRSTENRSGATVLPD